jgi:ribosomal protein S18 acetylase RimI-like enzyme
MKMRMAKRGDDKLLKEWLMDPEVLRYFPMHDEREVVDSVRVWMGFMNMKAAYTIEVDGKPVGMAVLYLQTLEKLKHQTLFAIVVDPKNRGKGIGTELCKEIEKEAKEKHGIRTLHLEVYEGNPAENLYRRLGFTEYGRHDHFLKEPSGEYLTKIVMEKKL